MAYSRHPELSVRPLMTRPKGLELDMLDKRDFSPIGYLRYNKSTGKPVEWENVVKGYEYRKGEYVALSAEDFRRANVEATQTIDIRGGKVVDLMGLLKESLEQTRKPQASRDRASGRRSSYARRRAARTRGHRTARRA